MLRADGWRWLACIAFRHASRLCPSRLRAAFRRFGYAPHTTRSVLADVDRRNIASRGSAAWMNRRKRGDFKIQGMRCARRRATSERQALREGSTHPTLSLLAMYRSTSGNGANGNCLLPRFVVSTLHNTVSFSRGWRCTTSPRTAAWCQCQRQCIVAEPFRVLSAKREVGTNSYCRCQAIVFPRNLAKQINQIFSTSTERVPCKFIGHASITLNQWDASIAKDRL